MRRLIIIRLLFGCLIAGIVILAYTTFFFACDFSSDDGPCAQSEDARLVFDAMLWLFLPAIVVLAVGWWRSEISIKDIAADRATPLKRFRLAMAVSLFVSLITAYRRSPSACWLFRSSWQPWWHGVWLRVSRRHEATTTSLTHRGTLSGALPFQVEQLSS